MLSSEYCEAAVEVLGILNELEESEFNKIPKKIIEFLENNKSKSYKPSIDFSEDVNKMVLKDKTRDILAGIYLDYLCKESEKQKFIDTIRKNALKYQEKIKEQFKNVDNICQINSLKVVKAFQEANLSEMHLNSATGYGIDEPGRNKIEEIYANISYY